MSGVRISGGSPKNPVRPRGGADFFRRPQRFEVYARRGKSPAGHHVVMDCTGSRRLFYLKSHLESVPSLLLSKMQTFHWFAFWIFLQRPKPVGHPAFLSILRKAGCPFLMFNIFLSGAAMRHAFLTVFQFVSNMPLTGALWIPSATRKPRFGRRAPIRNAAPIHRWVLRYYIISFYSQTAFHVPR